MDHLGNDLTPVLVTGASGYLGARVLALLRASGIEAVGISRSAAHGLTECNLSNDSAVARLMDKVRPRSVIHCAARVPRGPTDYADPILASANSRMLDGLLAHRPRRVIFPSSMTVYPNGIGLAREQDALATGPGYASAKLSMESRLLEDRNMDVAILRLPGLFGPPRRSGVLFNAAIAFARNADFQLRQPVPQWSALHIDDAANSMVKAMGLPGGHHVMNVGYPGRMAIPDAVERLARLFGGIWSWPSAVTWFEFDLSRSFRLLGQTGSDFQSRLRQLADWARRTAQVSL